MPGFQFTQLTFAIINYEVMTVELSDWEVLFKVSSTLKHPLRVDRR